MNMKRDYIDFQDRSEPIGFLITFRTFGSWLHGDKRGSVDRRTFNRVGEPKRPPNDSLKASDRALSKSHAFRLSKRVRKLTESAIVEVCKFKVVALYAVNVRCNHVGRVGRDQTRNTDDCYEGVCDACDARSSYGVSFGKNLVQAREHKISLDRRTNRIGNCLCEV